MNISLVLLLFGLLVMACLLLSDDLGDTDGKTPISLLFLSILRGFLVVCALGLLPLLCSLLIN